MKKVLMLMAVVSLSSCAEMQQVMNQLPQTQGISGVDIAGGLGLLAKACGACLIG